MKNLFALTFSLLLTGQVLAQITVTNATFPTVGATLRHLTDACPPALNLSTAGSGNQVWDFTALVSSGPVQTTAYLAPAGASGAASFPTANLRTGSVFYRKTATVVENLGTAGADLLNLGLNTTVRYQPPLPERRAPMNFFDIRTVESDLSWAVPTGDLDIGKDTTVAYHFFSGTEKEEVAVVMMNDAATEAQSVRFKYIAQSVAVEDVADGGSVLQVSPNPSFGPVEVQRAHFPVGEYWLHIRRSGQVGFPEKHQCRRRCRTGRLVSLSFGLVFLSNTER